MKADKSALGLGIFSAIAASLCCITPLLAIIAGTSGLASNLSWMEPLRLYLIGIAIVAIGFAWYQNLKPIPANDCNCDVPKRSFLQGKTFLSLITIFAALMLAFPSYAHIFYGQPESTISWEIDQQQLKTVEIEVTGMTCRGCEAHIEKVVGELTGVVESKASHQDENVTIIYDGSRVDLQAIKSAIRTSKYKTGNSKIIQ